MNRNSTRGGRFRGTAAGAGGVLVCVFFLVGVPLGYADLKVPSFVPPDEASQPVAVAQPISVRCIRGYGVQIRLNAATGEPTRRVDFLVREEPRHGRLGEIVPVPGDNDVAVVTYICDAAPGVTVDRFTYGARVWPGRVSAPVEVTIEIEEPVPNLEMVQEVKFGRVMMGTEIRTEVEIRNSGLKAYEEEIVLPEPLRAGETGRESVRIEPGQSVRIPIYFRPDRTGMFQDKYALMPDGEAMLYFSGEGVVPFSVDRSEVTLAWDGGAGKRTASVWIRDVMGADQQLVIWGGERLTLEQRLVLPRNESVELVLSIPFEDVASLSEEIRIMGGSYGESIKVRADATPALLEVKSLDKPEFQFGFVPEGVERSHTFVIRNRGGVSAPVKATVSRGYRLVEGLENFLLKPGEERGLVVAMETVDLGPKSGLFTIGGGGREFRIALSGTVIAKPEGEGEAEANEGMARAFETNDYETVGGLGGGGEVASDGGEMSKEDFWAPFYTVEWESREYIAGVASVDEVRQKSVTPYELEIYWKQLGDGFSYVIEFEAMWLDPETQELKKLWVPVEGVEFDERNGEVHARIGDLQPGSGYALRVLAINALGEVSAPSMIAIAKTLEVASIDWRRVYWTAAIGLLVVLLALKIWKWFRSRVTPLTPVKLTRQVET
ncbi:MAG: fibronectin type III domain-containing protein [Verrucomicrobiota bacterium]